MENSVLGDPWQMESREPQAWWAVQGSPRLLLSPLLEEGGLAGWVRGKTSAYQFHNFGESSPP